jgi:IS30 family transposase
MPSLPERKRRSFSVADKIRIIRMIESGKSVAEVSREVGLSPSTVSTIWKARGCVRSAYEKNMLGNKRLQRAAVPYNVEHALYQWCDTKRKESVDVSMLMLQEKAEEFAKLLGDNFCYITYKWLEKFRARYNM